MKALFAAGRSGRLVCALIAVCSAAAACGRKGPPLAPFVRVPAAVGEYSARRLGDDVVLQFTIPVANSDNSRPADVDRVEVYAHTGPLPSAADFIRFGTLVGNLAVKAPLVPGQTATIPGFDQGVKVSVAEMIGATQMTPGPMPVVRTAPLPPPPADLETPGTVNLPPPLMRYYVAVGISRRNRRGAFSATLGVPLVSPPAAPGQVASHYTQDALTLSWAAPAGDAAARSYNLYQIPDAAAVSTTTTIVVPAPAPLPAAPVNPVLLTAAAFTVTPFEFGASRCYVVRTVRVVNGVSLESPASPQGCVTPVDTFPPAAPKSLAAVQAENAVSLVWEPDTDADLAGYLILRASGADEKLTPLMPATDLLKDASYRDTTVMPGASYTYAVVAVDTARVPNRSDESNHVQVEIR